MARLNDVLLDPSLTHPRISARSILDRQQHSLLWVSYDPRSICDTLNNLLRCVLTAGTHKSIVTNDPDDIKSLSQSDPAGPDRAKEVDSIERLLSSLNPAAPIQKYFYLRQFNDEIRKKGAWGRAAVSSTSRLLVLTAEHDPTRHPSIQIKERFKEKHILRALRRSSLLYKVGHKIPWSGHTYKSIFGEATMTERP